MLFLILKESLKNIQENKSMMYLYSFVLILSFSGVIITDSLINSVAKTARSELRNDSESTITINFHISKSRELIANILSKMDIKDVFFRKTLFLKVGETPFASQLKKVTGIESEDVLFNVLRSDFGVKEKNSVIIENSNYDLAKKEYVYINDLPFKVNSVASKKKTVFLDSLGLNSLQEDGEFFIPLKTATRLLLNNEIDSARVVLKKEVDDINLMQLNTLLKSNGIDNYKIISFIDAKRAVDNVLNRFSLLTNIIYFFLTVTSIVISKSMSKKMFQCRSTEFALKMLNGINGKTVCIVIFVESSIVALLSIFVSLLISFVILVVVSRAISVELVMRYNALMTSVCAIAFFLCIYNTKLSYSLLSKELSTLIKERFL
ncbi:ftsX-like permease family protein [Escherichia coli 2741950]|uniref:hypothetical protein n=1 Tax=Escherichia coli TaxID=562 RepID=UPI0002CB76E9|nr:hypothetical protein [Escherichia coli]ENA81666.1 ftsX-like permease family protein [Escherichia coli 2741950]